MQEALAWAMAFNRARGRMASKAGITVRPVTVVITSSFLFFLFFDLCLFTHSIDQYQGRGICSALSGNQMPCLSGFQGIFSEHFHELLIRDHCSRGQCAKAT